MRLGVFTDSHYSSRELTCKRRRNSASLVKIEEALHYFQAADCDAVICLGDLIDSETDHAKEVENLRAVVRVMQRADLVPCFCLMGNHDAFRFTEEEFYGILGNLSRPSDFFGEGKRFIFLDTCYHRDGTHYGPGRSDWTDSFYPHVARLQEKLRTAQEQEIFLFLHQNLDPTVESRHIVSNAEEIRAVLEASGKKITVFQGHYHPGKETEYRGVRYITYPAMCESEECWFVVDC